MKETLYAFERGPSVFSYFLDENNMILKKENQGLRRYISQFGVANYRNQRAYITGGFHS